MPFQGCIEEEEAGEFPGAKYFLQRFIWKHKIGVKLLHENSIWDLSLFIEQDISDKT